MDKKAEAYKKYNNAAIAQMMIEVLPQIVENVAKPISAIKDVSIYSGDRTNPKLDIYGVKEKLDVVAIIRVRVEYNKRRKGIYEITNR